MIETMGWPVSYLRFFLLFLRKGCPSLRQLLMLVGMGLLLAGCGGGAPTETFDLSAAREMKRGMVSGQLVVAEPTGLQFYDSDRIVVRDGAAISYLRGAQWSDRLPKLVQARLIQSFENVMRSGAVGRTGERIAADRQINIEIRAFEINAGSREAVVELSAKLLAEPSGRIKASRIASARVPVGAIDGSAAATALDQALTQAMVQIVTWVR